jgi:hypothetical protein
VCNGGFQLVTLWVVHGLVPVHHWQPDGHGDRPRQRVVYHYLQQVSYLNTVVLNLLVAMPFNKRFSHPWFVRYVKPLVQATLRDQDPLHWVHAVGNIQRVYQAATYPC